MNKIFGILILIILTSCQGSQKNDNMIKLFKKNNKDSNVLRKERTEKILKSKGLKINYNLPLVESENETTIRAPKEIAERVTILAVTNMVAFNGFTGEEALDYLKKYNLFDKLTPKETEFLNNPTDERKSQETWKCEGIWTLMWALNVVDSLGFPDQMCDLNTIPMDDYPLVKGKDPNDFIKRFSETRNKSEILDAVDLYYRIDWACVDARINDNQMEIVNSGVVYERHYALNWLVNYSDQDWDDITCDT